MNHFHYNIISRNLQFKIISLFKKMYFGKTLLICLLYMASESCLYDSAMNHTTPSNVAVSDAATQEILPTSTEMGSTGATNIGALSDNEMVTNGETTAALVESQVMGTNTGKVEDGTATLVTATAIPDVGTSTNSSMFFMLREFF